jgi:hypothetical protein
MNLRNSRGSGAFPVNKVRQEKKSPAAGKHIIERIG